MILLINGIILASEENKELSLKYQKNINKIKEIKNSLAALINQEKINPLTIFLNKFSLDFYEKHKTILMKSIIENKLECKFHENNEFKLKQKMDQVFKSENNELKINVKKQLLINIKKKNIQLKIEKDSRFFAINLKCGDLKNIFKIVQKSKISIQSLNIMADKFINSKLLKNERNLYINILLSKNKERYFFLNSTDLNLNFEKQFEMAKKSEIEYKDLKICLKIDQNQIKSNLKKSCQYLKSKLSEKLFASHKRNQNIKTQIMNLKEELNNNLNDLFVSEGPSLENNSLIFNKILILNKEVTFQKCNIADTINQNNKKEFDYNAEWKLTNFKLKNLKNKLENGRNSYLEKICSKNFIKMHNNVTEKEIITKNDIIHNELFDLKKTKDKLLRSIESKRIILENLEAQTNKFINLELEFDEFN